jgi:uncharacterized membrane protein
MTLFFYNNRCIWNWQLRCLLAQALRQGDTSIIMPFDFLKLIWAVGIGYLFFFEVPSLNTWIRKYYNIS